MGARDYQKRAIDSLYKHLQERDDNPCIVIPTGGGKGFIVGEIARDVVDVWSGRLLVLTHVKELVEQNAKQAIRSVNDPSNVGIYSAGLKKKDLDHAVISAGIQSVYNKACDLGAFDLILIDEVHLVPEDGDGMYRTFLNDAKIVNPKVRIIGLTATPYRMKGGTICKPENILNSICFEVGVKQLIAQGYLSPLVNRSTAKRLDFDGLHTRNGDFLPEEINNLMDIDEVVEVAVAEITEATKDSKAVIIFSCGVEHGGHVARLLRESTGERVEEIYGTTNNRDGIISEFKAGEFRYLVNMAVLTTGFDDPKIDAVILMRPTKSAGLYYQMVGRGLRICDGKDACLVLDYGGNIERHGPIDMVKIQEPRSKGEGGTAPTRICPECQGVCLVQYSACPYCNYLFPEIEKPPHDGQSSNASILSGPPKIETKKVERVSYFIHDKKGGDPDDPKSQTLRVEYTLGLMEKISEWICLNHPKGSFAHNKAIQWWKRRSILDVPESVEHAFILCQDGACVEPTEVTTITKYGEKYPNIKGMDLPEPDQDYFFKRGKKPNNFERHGEKPNEWEHFDAEEDEDIPF